MPNDSNIYSFGSVGPHNVVLAHMPGMGKVSAATAATNLRPSFHGLRLVQLVGTEQGRTQLQSDVGENIAKLRQQLGKKTVFPGRSEDRLFRPGNLHKHRHLSESQTYAKDVDSACGDVIEMSFEELERVQGELQVTSRLQPGEPSQSIIHFELVTSGVTVIKVRGRPGWNSGSGWCYRF
ncbi:hypothetical protein MMYC01_205649 [Madurella mycetomatis]|uniref:Uncharacterized protein n=1 Tax=Madurella mycetomatis TaxID=100816 RepID=A0A175W4Y8_9PEZI|nr:hypothetical protein MMYC01_205649 [Madurella mycetomatis]